MLHIMEQLWPRLIPFLNNYLCVLKLLLYMIINLTAIKFTSKMFSELPWTKVLYQKFTGMLQMSSESISKPFSIIFRNCMKASHFPVARKKANVVSVHEKGNKQILTNYWPASLSPICYKFFEKLIFYTIFQNLMENNLLNPNQSRFMTRSFSIHHLVSITHETSAFFDANPL